MALYASRTADDKEIERPSRTRGLFRQRFLNLCARNQRSGRKIDGSEFVDFSFLDRYRKGNIDGLIRDDERFGLGHIDFDGRITLIVVEVLENVLKSDSSVLRVEAIPGLPRGQKAGLGLHGARDAGQLNAADVHRRRNHCEVLTP